MRTTRPDPVRAGVRRAVLSLPLLGASCAWVGGCASTHQPAGDARAYPAAPARGEVLNIQVFKHPRHVEFTNTTARSFGPCTLWLNGRFSRPIEGIGVGQTVRLPIREFRDEFSESMRPGGFFAIDTPDKLVLAELETEGRFLRLVVIASPEE